jgi:hypothetical protein
MDLRNILTHFVVDLENGAILTPVRSVSAGKATQEGIPNSSLIAIANVLSWRQKDYSKFDLYKDDLVWAVGGILDYMPEHLKTPEMYAKKELASLRHIYLYALEVFYQMYLGRTVDNYDQGLDAYINNEMEQCNPLAGYYTYAIKEYARILDIHPETAYNEFKLRYDTQCLARIRNFALYTKWIEIMNTCNTKEQLQKALKDANADIWGKAVI